MMRIRSLVALSLALVVLALAACGGGDDEDGDAATSPAPSEAPSGGATPPSPGALPPEIGECLADQGFEVEPSELHSVPPQVLNECFAELHQGGGAP